MAKKLVGFDLLLVYIFTNYCFAMALQKHEKYIFAKPDNSCVKLIAEYRVLSDLNLS